MTDRTSVPSFYFDVLQTLEEVEAPYMIIGGFAAAAYGSTRVTFDIDIVVDLKEAHIQALAERYPLPRYYADPQQMRDSIRLGILFNLIDTERGQKVDLVPITMDPRYRQAFARRIRRSFEDPSGIESEAWFARPEDVIVGKLMAWAEGQSRRHEDDIYSMLVFIYLGEDPSLTFEFDEACVDQQARALGSEVATLWQRLKEATRQQVSEAR
jgi:hypothetical protein